MRQKNVLVIIQLTLFVLIVVAAVLEIVFNKDADISKPKSWLTVNLLTAVLGLIGFLTQFQIRAIDKKYSLGAMLTEGYIQNFLLKVPEKLNDDNAAKDYKNLFIYIPGDICSTEKRNNRDTIKPIVENYIVSDAAPASTPESRFRLDSFTKKNKKFFIDYADTLSSLRAWVNENCPKKDGIKVEDEEKNRFGNRYVKEFKERLTKDISKHAILNKVKVVGNVKELNDALA